MDSLREELNLIRNELMHLIQRVAKLESGHRGSSMDISPQASMEQVERQRRENLAGVAFLRHLASRGKSRWHS